MPREKISPFRSPELVAKIAQLFPFALQSATNTLCRAPCVRWSEAGCVEKLVPLTLKGNTCPYYFRQQVGP